MFPPKGKPSIFWAGADGDTQPMSELSHILNLEMKNIGVTPEKHAYMPHMTVARLIDKNMPVRNVLTREFTSWIQTFSSLSFTIRELCLVESNLGHITSTYTIRRTFNFFVS